MGKATRGQHVGVVRKRQHRHAAILCGSLGTRGQTEKVGKNAGGNVIVVEAQTPRVIHPEALGDNMSGWEAHVLDILQRLLQEPRGRDARALDDVFKAYPFF